MSETSRCPHCGSPGAPGTPGAPLDALYREVSKIREIAEARAPGRGDGERRIAELTREVNELRATVARLRGTAMAGRPAPAGRLARSG